MMSILVLLLSHAVSVPGVVLDLLTFAIFLTFQVTNYNDTDTINSVI